MAQPQELTDDNIKQWANAAEQRLTSGKNQLQNFMTQFDLFEANYEKILEKHCTETVGENYAKQVAHLQGQMQALTKEGEDTINKLRQEVAELQKENGALVQQLKSKKRVITETLMPVVENATNSYSDADNQIYALRAETNKLQRRVSKIQT